MSKKPLVAIITGNSNSGSACIKEIYTRYSDKVNVRSVFRSDEKAAPFVKGLLKNKYGENNVRLTNYNMIIINKLQL